jgi:hypothetical protein
VTFDRPLFVVLCGHRHGPFFPELDLDRTSRDAVSDDIEHGQFDNILAVIEIDLSSGTCREATHDFEDRIPPD